ncbi:hypothetical protein [Microlunatus sp. GCM10028923]|uniref:hypothetical protein n=1 Tax=Microlunatus sp. GCM10028923 TaxID=3273400 RepID=UPI00360BC862
MTRAEVLGLARQYVATDSLQRCIDATASGPRSDAEVIADYLADANPYPDQTEVEVLDRVSGTWEPAMIVERSWPNEWRIDFDNAHLGRRWAGHAEIRFLAHPAGRANDLRPATAPGRRAL